MKRALLKLSKMHFLFCVLLSVMINMAIEVLSRKSAFELIKYMFDSPYVFLYNCVIILFTLLPVLFVRKRVFFYTTVSLIWIGFGITNSILLIFRTTPFTAVDFLLIKSAFRIIGNYFSTFGIVMIAALIISAVLLCFYLFIKAPKFSEKIPYLKYLTASFATIIIFIAATRFGTYTGRIAVNFGNIGEAFLTYGFPYCFSNSLFNMGIDRPKDYSDEMVIEILYNINENSPGPDIGEKERPNIIFLQLESFFDPKYMKDITFSKNPVPNFQSLKSEYSSGFVRVPSVGAGTANTEFEMITGMNLDFFGPGEYPYKTVLRNTACETYPFVLKALGYTAHAVHNNEGTFYDRNTVFSNLGFDTFTSVEYMHIEEKTSTGWAKDFYLTEYIMDCLKSTETPDYVYAISVQGHGKYPDEVSAEEYEILAYNEDGTLNPGFTYYATQIHEMDAFISELLDVLKDFNEKTVVVMYGDHLPSLGITDERLFNGDVYQTEYVIWSNFDTKNINSNLEAYQLGSHVAEMFGINAGIISLYHRFFSGQDDYLENLKVIQYDMLYGDNSIYNGEPPYTPTELQMGVKPIVIDNVIYSKENGLLYIRGNNFTEYSVVMIDGEKTETEYIDNQVLVCGGGYKRDASEKNKTARVICVAQIGKDKNILSLSGEYYYLAESEDE